MIKKIASFLWLSLGLIWLAPKIQAYDVPAYDGLVNDYAQILSTDFEQKLEIDLQQVAAASDGAEIAVVTIKSLDHEPIENVVQDIFDEWHIGKKELDSGILLLVVVEDQELRIQTGYGAEPIITDAEAGRIIRNQISPEFKAGDYEAGILAGVQAIKAQFEQSPGFTQSINPLNKNGQVTQRFVGLFFGSLLLIFGSIFAVYLVAWFGRSKAWWPGGLVGLGSGLLIGSMVVGVFFGLLGLLLDYILSKNYKKWKLEKKSTDWKKTWGGFRHSSFDHSGGSGSSSSGSSFSFGGGSSGGGGASGGW